MIKKKFSKISEILKDAKRGKMFILVDDEGRENEGDLIIPASKVTPKSINFMAKIWQRTYMFGFKSTSSQQTKFIFNVTN